MMRTRRAARIADSYAVDVPTSCSASSRQMLDRGSERRREREVLRLKDFSR